MPRRQFEGGRRQAWREDRTARDEASPRPSERARTVAPPPAGGSPVEPRQAPPSTQPRRRFQASGPEGADALLKRLGVKDAGFAEQYSAVQDYVRTVDHPLSGSLRSELRRRLLLPRRGNGRPMACERLEDVRANLDRVDQQIVELLAERGAYVAQAAGFKADAASVADPQRVEQVISQARGWAVTRGLDPDLVEVVYRTMVPAFIAYETARRGNADEPGS